MEDIFVEKSVKRDYGRMGILFPVFSITALVIFLVFLNGIPIIFGFNIIFFTGTVSLLLSYLLYRIIKGIRNTEYQIEITNDRFEISKVTDQKKIEVLAGLSIRDCEYIGPVTSDRFGSDLKEAEYSLNCTSKREYDLSDDIWYLCITQEKVRYNIIFEFDEQMYQVFRRYNPRGTKVINV